MAQVIPLDEANTVLASDSPFHLNSALHHPVDDVFGRLALGLVEEEDCWLGR